MSARMQNQKRELELIRSVEFFFEGAGLFFKEG